MTISPVSPEEIRAKFLKSKSRAKQLVSSLSDSPSPEIVHEARVAIRRLRASLNTMPGQYRKDGSVLKPMKSLGEVYQACSDIRDVDSLIEHLTEDGEEAFEKKLVMKLRERKAKQLRRLAALVKNPKTFRLPTPPDFEKKPKNRFKKLIRREAEVIKSLHAEASRSESEVSELHKLRKECRELTYLLEYAEPRPTTTAVAKTMEEARRMLGMIRDDDLLLGLLSHENEERAKELAKVIKQRRHQNYVKFFGVEPGSRHKSGITEAIAKI